MATKAVPKPQLRNLLQAQIKKNIIVAITLALVAGATFKYTVAEPRKRRYAEFYKNYDADAEFEKIRKTGVFDSVPAD